MTRVRGLAFASLFVLALSAQPVLSQDRNNSLPPPTNGTNADAPPQNPQNNQTTKPSRQRADGQHRHRRHQKGDPSQAQSSDGIKRQSPPPNNQPPQGSDSRN